MKRTQRLFYLVCVTRLFIARTTRQMILIISAISTIKTSVTTFQLMSFLCLLSLNLTRSNSITIFQLTNANSCVQKMTALKVFVIAIIQSFFSEFSLSILHVISLSVQLISIFSWTWTLTLAPFLREEPASNADLVKKLII